MSCGCGSGNFDLTKAAMCHLCRAGGREGGSVVACTVSGLSVGSHLSGGRDGGGAVCDRGRHPGADGRVRWLGLWWRGVPLPLRVRLWATEARGVPLDEFVERLPGCGCLDWIKTRWEWLAYTNSGGSHAQLQLPH